MTVSYDASKKCHKLFEFTSEAKEDKREKDGISIEY